MRTSLKKIYMRSTGENVVGSHRKPSAGQHKQQLVAAVGAFEREGAAAAGGLSAISTANFPA